MELPHIPSDVPFTGEQKAWLAGFLAGLNTRIAMPAGLAPATTAPAAPQAAEQPEADAPPAGPGKLLILYGTQTGNAEWIADQAKDKAAELGFDVTLTDMGEATERHPTERTREAAAVSVRYFVPRSQTTLIGAYRYYRDTWKVHAHTPEVRIIQQVGYAADASVRYRFHSQDGAFFYRDRYATGDPAMEPYVSDDVKLDTFTGHTFEAKLGILGETFGMKDRWSGARFEGILSYVLQHPRFGNAITAQLALTIPFEY